jgi:hypothetical protein
LFIEHTAKRLDDNLRRGESEKTARLSPRRLREQGIAAF